MSSEPLLAVVNAFAVVSAENQTLRARVAELVDETKPTAPRAWKLTKSEAKIFAALMRREILTHEAGLDVLYDDARRFDIGPDIVKVLICYIRKKGDAVIQSVHGQGYRLTRETKARVKAMIEAESMST